MKWGLLSCFAESTSVLLIFGMPKPAGAHAAEAAWSGTQWIISGAGPARNDARTEGGRLNGYGKNALGGVFGAALAVGGIQGFVDIVSNYSAHSGRSSSGISNATGGGSETCES